MKHSLALIVLAWLSASPFDCALSAPHRVTLDDIFKMENVDGVLFDPLGKRLVFERIPPYRHLSNYGVQTRQTAELYVYELDGKSQAHPLIAKHGRGALPDHIEGMWLGGFSPKGTRLAVYWLEGGATKAGVYDFSTGRLTIFGFTPDIQFSADSLVWLSEDELIYSAVPAGAQPPVPDWLRVSARKLAKAWEDAWQGEKATASVLESRAGEPDRSTPAGSLLRVNAQSGATHVLGNGRFSAFALSPDKHYLAALQMGRLRQLNPEKPVNWVSNPPGVRKFVMLFDLAKGGPGIALFPEGEATEETLAWSPSDDRVSFCTSRTSSDLGGIYYLYDATTGTRVAVPHMGLDLTSQRERGWQDVPDQAIPFGKGIAVPARTQADPKAPPIFTQKDVFPKGLSRVDWYEIAADGTSRNLTTGLSDVSAALISISKDGLYISADGGIWRIDPNGERHKLTAAFPSKLTYTRMFRAGGGESKDISAGVAVARMAGGADAPYVFIDLSSGQTTTLAVPANSGRMLAVSAAAQAAVMRGTGDAAWSLSLVSSARQQPLPFWVFNQHLSEVQGPRKVSLSYALPSGKTVQAEALLPADWTPGRRAPAVVYIYPNTSHYLPGSYYGYVNPSDDALLATLGYVVLYPYSSELELRTEDSPLGNWATLVLPAVDALVQAGYADPDRISTYGVSQGSWSVLALLTQTTRFKAAVAGYGVADFVSQYGSMGIGRRLWPDDLFAVGESLRYEASAGTYPHIGVPLLEDPMRYVRASPLFAAKKIETPLMLLHTDLDVNFPMSQFDEMFIQLVRQRKEAQYVRYWGEEHGLKSPANLRDEWSRMAAWFDQWSDVSRDPDGRIIYDGAQVRSRQGAPGKTPEEFLQLKWFFGS